MSFGKRKVDPPVHSFAVQAAKLQKLTERTLREKAHGTTKYMCHVTAPVIVGRCVVYNKILSSTLCLVHV